MAQEHNFLQIVDKLNEEFDTAQDEIIDLTKLLKIEHKKQFTEVVGSIIELREYYLDCGCIDESNTNPKMSGLIQFHPKHCTGLYYPDLDIIMSTAISEYLWSQED